MNKIIIGKETEFSKAFTLDNVLDFSRISEDNNPIHIDARYASESIFGKQVVHGVLLISMFSKIFGTIYPCNGAIYLSQTSKFLKPAFIGDIILAKAKLISFDNNKRQGVFLTECYKASEILIFTGEAKILFPKTFTL
jgi:3-hydroxybutyryl-CoA dehydratase|tara:strand:- start:859 stop:1272 length:414 start_codon:yes stop_codon:yes gene_type:complete